MAKNSKPKWHSEINVRVRAETRNELKYRINHPEKQKKRKLSEHSIKKCHLFFFSIFFDNRYLTTTTTTTKEKMNAIINVAKLIEQTKSHFNSRRNCMLLSVFDATLNINK